MLKSTKKALALSLFLSMGSFGLQAQSGTLTAGGEGTGDGSVSYSIGLVGFEASNGQSGSLEAGLQHATVSVLTGADRPEINLVAEVFPNPTVNNVTLKVEGLSLEELNFMLLDMIGTVIQKNSLNNSSTTINLGELASTTFLLKVFKKNQEIKTFKIVKN